MYELQEALQVGRKRTSVDERSRRTYTVANVKVKKQIDQLIGENRTVRTDENRCKTINSHKNMWKNGLRPNF
jgi:hypothetical protein